jgi:hypothetical protein
MFQLSLSTIENNSVNENNFRDLIAEMQEAGLLHHIYDEEVFYEMDLVLRKWSDVREGGELFPVLLLLLSEADPGHVFYNSNIAEYDGYAHRITLAYLRGERSITDLWSLARMSQVCEVDDCGPLLQMLQQTSLLTTLVV